MTTLAKGVGRKSLLQEGQIREDIKLAHTSLKRSPVFEMTRLTARHSGNGNQKILRRARVTLSKSHQVVEEGRRVTRHIENNSNFPPNKSTKNQHKVNAMKRKKHLLFLLTTQRTVILAYSMACILPVLLMTLASVSGTQIGHLRRLPRHKSIDLVPSGTQLGLMDSYNADAGHGGTVGVSGSQDLTSTIAGSSGASGSGDNSDDSGSYTADDESNDPTSSLSTEDESADQSHELPDRNLILDHHNSQLRAMHQLFERRQLNNHQQQQQQQLQASQELSPISIGVDPVTGAGSPFNMNPFQVPHNEAQAPHSKPLMSNVDNIDQGLGPSLPFGLNHLPHLLGFQSSSPFDGPQRGDQSAHSNHHALPSSDSESVTSSAGGQKVWPKIFRFTDGRISLEDFEKQKKIRLSNKNKLGTENHIESAPIMFDGRQLKRKSFLILHGGIFS